MSRDHDYYVHIVTNHTQTVLYIGVTSDIEGRLWEHANGEGSKFTRKYQVNRLVFYEHFREVRDALAREKQLKGSTRAKKESLLRTMNPNYADLAADWYPAACRRPEGLPSAVSQTRLSTLACGLASAQDDRVI